MKKCRTVKGIISAINKGEKAELKVWGIEINHHDKDGAYLNLGEGKYAGVGKTNWSLIRDFIVDQNGESIKNNPKYKAFFK